VCENSRQISHLKQSPHLEYITKVDKSLGSTVGLSNGRVANMSPGKVNDNYDISLS